MTDGSTDLHVDEEHGKHRAASYELSFTFRNDAVAGIQGSRSKSAAASGGATEQPILVGDDQGQSRTSTDTREPPLRLANG